MDRLPGASLTPAARRGVLLFCVALVAPVALLGVGVRAAHAAHAGHAGHAARTRTVAVHAGTFTRGFVDDVWFDGTQDGVSTQTWLANTRKTGAKIVQIEVDWTGIEPNAPAPGASLTNPAAPQFDFSSLDQRVQEIVSAGLTPVLLVTDAPQWAEGAGGSAALEATGGYKPNAKAFGALGQALATRYSGHYPNPAEPGKMLPRVRYIQAWAEANVNIHLSPQWTRIRGRAVNTGALMYRAMLNDFYAGVKAGDPGAVVLSSGLESYGDAPFTGLRRTHPVTFLENLLCLTPALRRAPCAGGGAHFDVLASDPYEAFSPTTPAVSPLDASAPDLGRLTRVVTAALARHTLLPHRPKPLWVTEFGYESNPPNTLPGTPSMATQARWLEQSFYIFWHEGVSVTLWYLMRDQAPPYTINYASGVYFYGGKPKPSFTAYHFPLVVMRQGTAAQAWGITPVTGLVRVQFRDHGWRTVASFRRRAGAVFDFTSKTLRRGQYRALAGGQKSLVWTY